MSLCIIYYCFEFAQLLIWFTIHEPFECSSAVGYGMHYLVLVAQSWICNVLVLELDGVGKALVFG